MIDENSIVLLNRVLSLKESSPLIVIIDTLFQTGQFLVEEFVHKATNHRVIYVSYETVNKPGYACEFIDCLRKSLLEVVGSIRESIASFSGNSAAKILVIIDSLNYIASEGIASTIAQISGKGVTILGVCHSSMVLGGRRSESVSYPSTFNLLNFIASSVFEIHPCSEEALDEEALELALSKLQYPRNNSINSRVFKAVFLNKRKSGRSLQYQFMIDTSNHTYTPITAASAEEKEDDESLLKNLTTFNLTTNSKQKLAKEQVELPFMQAQEELGSYGGAIVYEFEKDDDYDEEDPYEDPF